MSAPMTELRFRAAGMSCERCRDAETDAVSRVNGVVDGAVDLDTKLVRVRGTQLDVNAPRTAIEDAGYEAEAA